MGMTEQAIEILKELWRYEKSDKYTDEEIREAIFAAISSLETDEAYQLEYERTTKNDLGVDCIDRQKYFTYLDGVADGLDESKNDVNEVLDKIRAEIETEFGRCDLCEYFVDYDYNENDISEYREIGSIADILRIIDKYKAEVEPQESECTYEDTGCGSCKRQLDCPIKSDKAESEG